MLTDNVPKNAIEEGHCQQVHVYSYSKTRSSQYTCKRTWYEFVPMYLLFEANLAILHVMLSKFSTTTIFKNCTKSLYVISKTCDTSTLKTRVPAGTHNTQIHQEPENREHKK